MSNETPKPGFKEIRNPVAAVEELYSDISSLEAGESPDEIAQRWRATEDFMNNEVPQPNRDPRWSGLAAVVLKAISKRGDNV